MSFEIPHGALIAFGLASVRLLAFVFTAPFFSHGAVPLRIRAALALLLAVALGPGETATAHDPVALAFATLGEALLGAGLGLVAALPFAAIGLAAEASSVQGGLSAAAALDPASGASTTALATLAQGIALLVFLAAGGQHELLRGIAQAFVWIPPGALSLEHAAPLSALGAEVFTTGLRFAAPYSGALLLSNVVVGLLGRTIPQLNLLSVQLPAQIAAVFGLFALGAVPFCDAVAAGTPGLLERAVAFLAGGAP
jgi:flagellar biosynthetic protein FliR